MLRTPFYQYHVDQGAKMVEFAGWSMPLYYTSIIAEHRQVRESGGMFDVSHMGRLHVRGRDARAFLEFVCTRRVSDMASGQCRYSLICNESGGVRDDVLIYRDDEQEFMLVVNAANRAKIIEHFDAVRTRLVGEGRLSGEARHLEIDDRTEKSAMLAVQGPKVMGLIGNYSDEIPALKKYRFCVKNLLFFKVTISRTGYTGEDGVEVILPGSMAAKAVTMMVSQVPEAAANIAPCGLGARDTLRLEAGMPLYGHEMDEETDPISAGLMFGINLDKEAEESGGGSEEGSGVGGEAASRTPHAARPEVDAFLGQSALRRIHADGPRQRLVGLLFDGKRTPRQGMAVLHRDQPVGRITSGCFSPTFERPIAMGYVPAELAEPETAVQVNLGSTTVEAQVTNLPFYKRAKEKAAGASS